MATYNTKKHRQFTLHASGAETETGTGSDVILLPEDTSSLWFELDVTVLATATGDTFDAYVQTSFDGGTSWIDVHHFDQLLGDGSAETLGVQILRAAISEYDTTAALAEETSLALIGDRLRCRWAITDADTDDASFTFALVGVAN